MNSHAAELFTLAEQVRQGDRTAADKLQSQLEPRLVAIVARALRADSEALPLTRWIRGQAAQVTNPGQLRAGDRARLVVLLARRFGQRVIDRLQAGLRTTRLLDETICLS